MKLGTTGTRSWMLATMVASSLWAAACAQSGSEPELVGDIEQAAEGVPACLVTDPEAQPPKVSLPGVFPAAPNVIASMSQWLDTQCTALLPGSSVVPDDVTCELRTELKDTKPTGVTGTCFPHEYRVTQYLASTRTYYDAAGKVLGQETSGPGPEPSNDQHCYVQCAGELKGTLATANVIAESANNAPPGLLPPGFCKELQTRLRAQSIDCGLDQSTGKWSERIKLDVKAPWRKRGDVEHYEYTWQGDEIRDEDRKKYPTVAKIVSKGSRQGWEYDDAAGDAICKQKVSAEQMDAACKMNPPKSTSAQAIFPGGVCLAKKDGEISTEAITDVELGAGGSGGSGGAPELSLEVSEP